MTETTPSTRKISWSLAHTLLRMGQIDAPRYFELCREHGWPQDRVPSGKELEQDENYS